MISGKMTKELFKQLCSNYGKDYNEEKMIELYKCWNEALKEFDSKTVEQVVKEIMMVEPYFPNLAKITKELRKQPEWLGKEIESEPISEESKKIDEEFKETLEEFRKWEGI